MMAVSLNAVNNQETTIKKLILSLSVHYLPLVFLFAFHGLLRLSLRNRSFPILRWVENVVEPGAFSKGICESSPVRVGEVSKLQ